MSTLEIEYCPAITSDPCPDCDGVTTTLNRLVKREGVPFAMCRIMFSGGIEEPARAIMGVGRFGEGTEPHQRVAFALRMKPEGVMVVDALECDWPESDILGPKLTRDAALQHPLKGEVFRVIDELYANDESLRGHLGLCSQGPRKVSEH